MIDNCFDSVTYNDGFALMLSPSACRSTQDQRLANDRAVDYVAGTDEAGRGPLLGPVAVASVILDPDKPIDGLTDSKKLSEKKREALFQQIVADALSYAIIFVSPQKVDEINILQATLQGMKKSVEALHVQPHHVRIDGNKTVELSMPCEAVVGGDALHAEISAASILAKVSRDRYMYALHEKYPEFGINKHKGYPTKLHREMLEKHGAIPEHRRSFKPVSQFV